MAAAVLMALPSLLFFPALQRKTLDVLVTEAENQEILVENFKGAMTLKTSHGTPQAWDKLQARFARLANVTFRTVQIAILNNFTSTLMSGMGAIAILWFGGWLVIQQTLSIGQLLAFNALYRYVTNFVNSVIRFVDEFARAKTAMQRLGDIIEASPENVEQGNKPWVDIPADENIICSDIAFHHAGRVNLL